MLLLLYKAICVPNKQANKINILQNKQSAKMTKFFTIFFKKPENCLISKDKIEICKHFMHMCTYNNLFDIDS